MSKYSLRVARTFVEALADTPGQLAIAVEELKVVAGALDTKEIELFLANPRISTAEKTTLVLGVLKEINPAVLALVRVLIAGSAIGEIRAIAKNVQEIASSRLGITTAMVETANKLDTKTLTELTTALAELTGKKVSVETRENAALLAGVKVTVDGDVLDLSLAGKLKKLAGVIG